MSDVRQNKISSYLKLFVRRSCLRLEILSNRCLSLLCQATLSPSALAVWKAFSLVTAQIPFQIFWLLDCNNYPHQQHQSLGSSLSLDVKLGLMATSLSSIATSMIQWPLTSRCGWYPSGPRHSNYKRWFVSHGLEPKSGSMHKFGRKYPWSKESSWRLSQCFWPPCLGIACQYALCGVILDLTEPLGPNRMTCLTFLVTALPHSQLLLSSYKLKDWLVLPQSWLMFFRKMILTYYGNLLKSW